MKKKKLMIARVLFTVLTVCAVGAIFYNSSLSADLSAEQSSPLTAMINAFLSAVHIPLTLSETVVRKLAHFTEYAVMGALLCATARLYAPGIRRMLCVALPLGAVVAVCDELLQLFSAGRSCEVRDMLIDFTGVLFAATVVSLLLWIRKKRKGSI